MKKPANLLLSFLSLTSCLIALSGCVSSRGNDDFNRAQKTTDQGELAKLALYSQDFAARREAVNKLTDPSALAEIAITSSHQFGSDEVPATALERLSDQSTLARVAMDSKDEFFRNIAAQKLTNQSVLAAVTTATRYNDIREIAAAKLSDEALVKVIADQPADLREDFERATRDKTVESLSGFIKHHQGSIPVGKALDKIWNLLLTEFPASQFNCSTSFDLMRNGLPPAIEEGLPFVVSFAPKTVQDYSVNIQFRELAGKPETIGYLDVTFTRPNGDMFGYRTAGDSVISNWSIQPYGQGSYSWFFGRADGSTVYLCFKAARRSLTSTYLRLTGGDDPYPPLYTVTQWIPAK